MDVRNERLNILQLCINTLGFDHVLQFSSVKLSLVEFSSVRVACSLRLDCVHHVFELDWVVTLKL